MSNTESIPVAKSDREMEDIAAYTVLPINPGKMVERSGHTLENTERRIGNQTTVDGNLYLGREGSGRTRGRSICGILAGVLLPLLTGLPRCVLPWV